MEVSKNRLVRFKLNFDKCIEGIDLLAWRKPGLTQYYVCKIFYFADKAHLMDWGRPISGDRYVAMEHGPVPSYIYDFLKDTGTEPDEIVDRITSRIEIVQEGNKLKVYSKGKNSFPHLSGTDIEYLENALKIYGSMGFGQVRSLSHEDPAYEAAWRQSGANNEMDIRLWFKNEDWEGINVLNQLEELSHPSCSIVN